LQQRTKLSELRLAQRPHHFPYQGQMMHANFADEKLTIACEIEAIEPAIMRVGAPLDHVHAFEAINQSPYISFS